MHIRFMSWGRSWLTASVGVFLTLACADADPALSGEEDQSVGMEQAELVATCPFVCKPTTSCSTGCSGQGTCRNYGQCADLDTDGDGVPSGRDNCPSVSNPNQANCDGDALGDACETDLGRYTLVRFGNTLCQFDPDLHIDGADVEIYTADLYRDTSCRHLPDAYLKRQVASVHCGFHSEGTCENRVTQRVIELAAQGYTPATDGEGDDCPLPRITRAAIGPSTPPIDPLPDPPCRGCAIP
jgi:hypothetical protein